MTARSLTGGEALQEFAIDFQSSMARDHCGTGLVVATVQDGEVVGLGA